MSKLSNGDKINTRQVPPPPYSIQDPLHTQQEHIENNQYSHPINSSYSTSIPANLEHLTNNYNRSLNPYCHPLGCRNSLFLNHYYNHCQSRKKSSFLFFEPCQPFQPSQSTMPFNLLFFGPFQPSKPHWGSQEYYGYKRNKKY